MYEITRFLVGVARQLGIPLRSPQAPLWPSLSTRRAFGSGFFIP